MKKIVLCFMIFLINGPSYSQSNSISYRVKKMYIETTNLPDKKPNDEAVEIYSAGVDAFNAGKIQNAISLFSQSIKISPNKDSYFNRGMIFLSQNDSCKYCDDMLNAARLGDEEAKEKYVKGCANSTEVTAILLQDSSFSEGYKYFLFIDKCTQDSSMITGMMNIDDLKLPEFPGGQSGLQEFLARNLEYPTLALEYGIQGIVKVSFLVKKDGKIEDIKIENGIGGGCDEECIRLVKKMPKWKPAKLSGKVVDMPFKMPVYFKIN